MCDSFNKRVSINIDCCGVLWFLSSVVCSVFLIMFPEYVLMSCVWVITYLVLCVLVLRCGSAGVVWCPYAGWTPQLWRARFWKTVRTCRMNGWMNEWMNELTNISNYLLWKYLSLPRKTKTLIATTFEHRVWKGDQSSVPFILNKIFEPGLCLISRGTNY
jgi:hypothetical protein